MGSFKLLALLALSTSALSADINTPPIGTPTPATTAATPTDVSYPTITLAPDVVAVGDSTILIIDSTTLTPGPDLHTIGIHTISFGSSGSFAIDGSTSNFLSLETPTQPDTVNPPSNTPTFTPEVPDSSTPSSIESTEDPTPSSGPSTTTEDVISQETPTVIDTPTTTLVDPSTPTETLQTPTTTQGDPTPDTSAPVTTEISEPPATPSGPVSTPTDQTTFTTTGTPGANPITSTMTEPPPEFSTEGITSEGLTTNTWITTTKDGDTTVVPVIVGCPGCGGALGGIILWNLPPIPNVVFKFPSFPNLPSFYLPCIRILGVSVGQCTQGPSEPPEDGDDSKPSTTKEDKTTTEEQTTTTATSCGEVETVTDIVVACSTGLFSGTATTDCYSTSTEIVTGCSVTASVETIYTGGFCAMRPSAAARGPVEVYSFEGYVPFTLPDITDDVSGTPVSTPNDPQDTPSSTANDPQDTPSTTAPTTTFPSTPTSFTTSVIRTPTTSTEDPDTTPTNTPSTVESPSIPSTPTTEDTSAATPTTTEDTSAATPTTPASTTTLPPRVPAPDITINAPDATPECSQGYATYTMSAVASAPANAESLKFIIPQADERENKDWRFDLSPGFLVDPKTNVKSWEVGTSDGGDPIASGDGGEDMEITWLSPKDANGTYVKLTFTDDPPLGVQTYGVVATGGSFACMPSSCNGPPTITTSKDGLVCKKYPCSTQPSCEPGGPITPSAACLLIEDGVIFPLFYDVTIVTNNWITDDGAKLKSEEKGCGSMTAWKHRDISEESADGTWTASHQWTFTLPLTMKGGCVERAIASAGGPEGIHCDQGVSDWVF